MSGINSFRSLQYSEYQRLLSGLLSLALHLSANMISTPSASGCIIPLLVTQSSTTYYRIKRSPDAHTNDQQR